ncbi:hypothetical protein LJC31_05295 [Synergistaceae bacterium OttesenSCG-928-I11]|nr:hypothetical protein [Synergistaceae bacterium OttesenSCG-928-I11]
MPFCNSYIDPERDIPSDAREKFAALAPQVVRDPISTHFVRTERNGKACFLVIDMAAIPDEGGLVVLSTDAGLRVSRLTPGTPPDRIWGTVVWYLQQA